MDTVRVERPSRDVAVITLDRPERLNALSFELVDDLHAALDEVDGDNTCRVVVLTGAGRGFCSGLILKSLQPSMASAGLRALPESGGVRVRRGRAHRVRVGRGARRPGPGRGHGAGRGDLCPQPVRGRDD